MKTRKKQNSERAARKLSNCGNGFLMENNKDQDLQDKSRGSQHSSHGQTKYRAKFREALNQWLTTKQCRLTHIGLEEAGKVACSAGTLGVTLKPVLLMATHKRYTSHYSHVSNPAARQLSTIIPVTNVSICAAVSRSDAREELESKKGL